MQRDFQPSYEHLSVKYSHIGIPTTAGFDGEIDLPELKMTVSDHEDNPFGIQWQRYWEGAPYPDLVKTVPHVAFEVDDLDAARYRLQLAKASIFSPLHVKNLPRCSKRHTASLLTGLISFFSGFTRNPN